MKPFLALYHFKSGLLAIIVFCVILQPKTIYALTHPKTGKSGTSSNNKNVLILSPLIGVAEATVKRPGTRFHGATKTSDYFTKYLISTTLLISLSIVEVSFIP